MRLRCLHLGRRVILEVGNQYIDLKYKEEA
jgi:hypothetical protein